MGAWDATSFGNDTANDWAYDLEESDDLSHIEATIQQALEAGDEYLDADLASEAVAAAEVLAWLRGKPSTVNGYTAKIAEWVEAHPIEPSATILQQALSVLERIQGDASELAELWEGDEDWIQAMAGLRNRLSD